MSQTGSRPVSRTAEFTHHFTAALVRLGRSYDLHNEPQLKINIENTMKISTRLPFEDICEFMAKVGKAEIETPYLWQTAISKFIADKYPAKEENLTPVPPSEYGMAMARAIRITFGVGIDQKLRPLVKAIAEYKAHKDTGRLKMLDKKYIFRIKEASLADRRRVLKAIKVWEKNDIQRRSVEYLRSIRKKEVEGRG